LRFEELRNPCVKFPQYNYEPFEIAFEYRAFKALEERKRKTSIDTFTSLLRPTRIKVITKVKEDA